MAINFPLPYMVDTKRAVDYNTVTLNQIQQHMYQVSVKLEDALRNEGRLCGLLGHTIIGRYQLKGTFEEVLANMIYFRIELISTIWTREELRNMASVMNKRCIEFVRETFYNTPAMTEANRLHDMPDNKKQHMIVLDNYQMHLHNANQCICHCNT